VAPPPTSSAHCHGRAQPVLSSWWGPYEKLRGESAAPILDAGKEFGLLAVPARGQYAGRTNSSRAGIPSPLPWILQSRRGACAAPYAIVAAPAETGYEAINALRPELCLRRTIEGLLPQTRGARYGPPFVESSKPTDVQIGDREVARAYFDPETAAQEVTLSVEGE